MWLQGHLGFSDYPRTMFGWYFVDQSLPITRGMTEPALFIDQESRVRQVISEDLLQEFPGNETTGSRDADTRFCIQLCNWVAYYKVLLGQPTNALQEQDIAVKLSMRINSKQAQDFPLDKFLEAQIPFRTPLTLNGATMSPKAQDQRKVAGCFDPVKVERSVHNLLMLAPYLQDQSQ